MKKCFNCDSTVKEEDIYCRFCGLKLRSNSYYIWLQVLNILAILGLLILIAFIVITFIWR